ncbi:MAG: hypothetical protein D6B28_04265 [Gammaproteobacteria bacterium]|nr:MAG: hypothetical protein D6B28_04265 [Gammaproteobacteria bacterium]
MSEENLFEAPQSDVYECAISNEKIEHLLVIAKRQKHLIYTFALYFIVAGVLGQADKQLQPLLSIVAMPIFFAIVVLNIRLCWKIYGTFGKIIMISLGLIPLINFISVLIASSSANRILKKSGFKVGFMGAKIKEIELAACVK